MTNRSKARALFDVLVGAVGAAAGAISVWQFVLPTERQDAYLEGKREIAAEVVMALSKAGFNTNPAETAFQDGNYSEAVTLATKATLAPPVATVPDQPFKLRNGEVIDLPTGEMLSFRLVSAPERIVITAGGEKSSMLRRGESYLHPRGCQIDYIDIEREDGGNHTATLRAKC